MFVSGKLFQKEVPYGFQREIKGEAYGCLLYTSDAADDMQRGELSEESLEGAMKALNDAYWIAKEKNRKFTPKKYRTTE